MTLLSLPSYVYARTCTHIHTRTRMHAHLEGAICKPGSELSPGTTPTSRLLLGFPSSRSGRNKNKMLLMDRSVYCQMILCYCRGQRHTWALGLCSPLPSRKSQEFYLSHYSYSVPLWGTSEGRKGEGSRREAEVHATTKFS